MNRPMISSGGLINVGFSLIPMVSYCLLLKPRKSWRCRIFWIAADRDSVDVPTGFTSADV